MIVIILQYINLSNQHVHLKLMKYYVNYILIKNTNNMDTSGDAIAKLW